MKLFLYIPFFILASSFLGGVHPAFDSIGVFREYIIIVVFICLIIPLVRKKHFRIILFVFSLYSVMSVSNFSISQLHKTTGYGERYSLYQKNLSFRNHNFDDIIKDIEKLNPDFITLQEVTQKAKTGLLDTLLAKYPYQHYCDYESVGGVASLSKIPFIDNSQKCLKGVALTQIKDKGSNNPWLASFHLHWPWPYSQNDQVEEILPVLSNLKGYKIIAGDFNMVKWSTTIAKFNKALNTKAAKKGTGKTFHLMSPLLSFQIDHVLMPKNAIAESSIRPFYGSDHKGLYVKFWTEG